MTAGATGIGNLRFRSTDDAAATSEARHEAVLAATSSYADPRLVPMRAGVRRELDQFAGLAGLPPKRV